MALEVWCLVNGNESSAAFSVDADASTTIGRLKELIKSKTTETFKGIDAKDLKLWCASISWDSPNIIKLDELPSKDTLSNPRAKLESVYPQGQGSNDCIIVQLPQSDDERQSEAPGIMDVIKKIQGTFSRRDRIWDSAPQLSDRMPWQERPMAAAIDRVVRNVRTCLSWKIDRQIAKTESSFLVCSGTAGIGKTRYGRELYQTLQRELTSAARTKGLDYAPHYYYMLLDFDNGDNLRPEEAKFSAATILGLRLAYAHFFKGKYREEFPEFCHEAAQYEKLFTISRVIIAIRQALKLPGEKPLFLFLHIDEFQRIFNHYWKGPPEGHRPEPTPETEIRPIEHKKHDHTEEGLYLFREMMRGLGSFMSGASKPDMIQTFLSGTARQEVIQTAEPTFYSFEFLSCPTLSMGARYDIMRHFTALSEVHDYEWMPEMAFFRLLSATGGLPRALQLLLEDVFGYGQEKCSTFRALVDDISLNADQIFRRVANKLDNYYSITAFAQEHKELVRALVRLCIFQQPCLRSHAPSDHFPKLTLDALERHTHTILEESEKAHGRVLVRIPFFFLNIYNSAITEIQSLLFSAFLKDWEQFHGWRFFETIIAEYEVFRTGLIIGGGSKTASLKEIYQGAFGRTKTLDRTVNLRELTHVQADYRFPEGGPLVVKGKEKAWDLNMVIENAAGAQFGDVCVCRTGTGAGSDKILFALQAKMLADDKTVSINLIQEEHDKNLATIGSVPLGSTLHQQGIQDAKVITVVITTADFNDQYLDGQSIPEDCLLVCRRNFTEFFGDAFGLPIALSLSKDRNWNFATRESLRKHKLGEEEVSQVLMNIPYRSHEDLIRKVPALSSKELDKEMGFLPYEDFQLGKRRRVS
ncbi:hypothetical protein B0O80DRAFT_496941 [Mortierella sp. GBAus27b]|nr:hypothetical protein BGX31_002228 [Mortierella sp. GBA43]KAI8356228.1 hypothetical protein B0O80DRAFT_496941 [Mortierella sp. GBAus27b]